MIFSIFRRDFENQGCAFVSVYEKITKYNSLGARYESSSSCGKYQKKKVKNDTVAAFTVVLLALLLFVECVVTRSVR